MIDPTIPACLKIMQLTKDDGNGPEYEANLRKTQERCAVKLILAGYEKKNGKWVSPAEEQTKEWKAAVKNFSTQERDKKKPIRPSSVCALPGSGIALRVGVVPDLDHTGLLKKLVETYIQQCVEIKKEAPFLVEFYELESSLANQYLEKNIIDVAFTDNIASDLLAIAQGIVDRVDCAWHDHWMLVGPKTNPIHLPTNCGKFVRSLFVKLYTRIPQAKLGGVNVDFLSRLDGSTCNVKESSIWTEIGRTPWSVEDNLWYTTTDGTAVNALEVAAEEGSYTLTDRSTWWASEQAVRDSLTIFAIGDDDVKDLRKPIDLIVGSQVSNKERANDFANWMVSQDGGQQVVKGIQQDGQPIYSPAPPQNEAIEDATSEAAYILKHIAQDGTFASTGDAAKESSSNVHPPVVAEPLIAEHQPAQEATPAQEVKVATSGVARAGVNLYWSGNEVYFFDDTRYVRVDVVKDSITYGGAKDIQPMWPGLRDVKTVDAILPTGPKASTALFFTGDTCALLEVRSGALASGSSRMPWSEAIPALRTAGFNYIDCIVPHWWNGSNTAHATFYCGSKCLTLNIETDETVGEVQDLPDVFREANFSKVDTFVFVPGSNNNDGYFFSDGRYIRVQLQVMKMVYGISYVQSAWTSLNKANFFSASKEGN